MTLWSRRCLAAFATALAMLTGASLVAAQSPVPPGPAPPLRTDSIARVARVRASSVVALHTLSPGPDETWDLLTPPTGQQGLGSGVVVDAHGLIVTNAHVVAGAHAVHVRTPDGDDVIATVIGTDPDLDLALLRASDVRGLRPAPLGDSDRLRVGDWVVAIGNPLGLHHTVTAGIVSAKARALDDSGVEFLQTDAAISPGSSGGPLLNLAGAVVGINVGILSPNGMNVGLNLAIPVSIVTEVLPRLLTGSVDHGWIGVVTAPLSPAGAAARKLSAGLILIAVTDNGPAAQAGLLSGDVVTGFADSPSLKLRDLYRHVRARPPGTVVRLEVWRNRQRLVVPVEVGRRPNPDDVRPSSARGNE
ncbi:MAG: trypsin-like peptidase domain-containing protein [Acidobacteria bacterium]|nr:trypsin-like peptidase domain-containing protein [Acidobacteriota bacterium]